MSRIKSGELASEVNSVTLGYALEVMDDIVGAFDENNFNSIIALNGIIGLVYALADASIGLESCD